MLLLKAKKQEQKVNTSQLFKPVEKDKSKDDKHDTKFSFPSTFVEKQQIIRTNYNSVIRNYLVNNSPNLFACNVSSIKLE